RCPISAMNCSHMMSTTSVHTSAPECIDIMRSTKIPSILMRSRTNCKNSASYKYRLKLMSASSSLRTMNFFRCSSGSEAKIHVRIEAIVVTARTVYQIQSM
ncbi:hypothetical protein PENTCL1PPCAC_15655, partial [Pristionchus entomophagus]